MSGNYIVELTQHEIDNAGKLSEKRLKTFFGGNKHPGESKHIQDKTSNGKGYSYKVGALGEVAFGKAICEIPDRSISATGDDGYDFTVNELNIEIKTTRRAAKELLIRNDRIESGHYEDTDVYVCVYQRDIKTYEIVGYATYEQVLEKDPRNHPKSITNKVIPEDELKTTEYNT
jgi:hypothetical protein